MRQFCYIMFSPSMRASLLFFKSGLNLPRHTAGCLVGSVGLMGYFPSIPYYYS